MTRDELIAELNQQMVTISQEQHRLAQKVSAMREARTRLHVGFPVDEVQFRLGAALDRVGA